MPTARPGRSPTRLLAANDSNYYLYDKKKKGDFGRKETRRDEVTDVKAVGSQISSGGDLRPGVEQRQGERADR
ncbi:hypothetical protein RLJV_24110 [Pseudomonas aeruginosa]|nr:hypothetical protein RLJV_24110 [Pseudomonas aeruginosa]